MPDARRLVPVWIVYVDGERLDPMYEGALERIVVDDQLDGVGSRCWTQARSRYVTAGHLRLKVRCLCIWGIRMTVRRYLLGK